MAHLPSRFRRLDEILADLPVEDPLLLSELDGYLTGVALCPEPIAPIEWLPPIWGGHYGESAPFEDPIDVQMFADMVAARHAEIVRDLARGKPQPILDTDLRSREVLWEDWIAGFDMAMALRPESWSTVPDAGALAALQELIEIAGDTTTLTSIEVNAISDSAAVRLPGYLVRLTADRAPASSPPPPAKTGRNDPCPCGSGRKHKRCCA